MCRNRTFIDRWNLINSLDRITGFEGYTESRKLLNKIHSDLRSDDEDRTVRELFEHAVTTPTTKVVGIYGY